MFIALGIFLILILASRLAYRLYKINGTKPVDLKAQTVETKKIDLLVVFGSGGHTTEMNMILKDYDFA